MKFLVAYVVKRAFSEDQFSRKVVERKSVPAFREIDQLEREITKKEAKKMPGAPIVTILGCSALAD